MKSIPTNQEELDALADAANRHQGTFTDDTIMGMLHGRCTGGALSPFSLSYRYVTAKWMSNPLGITHGGLLASMFDNAMGLMAFALSPEGSAAPTAELHVSYLKPVPIEQAIVIRVQADQISGRMIRMRAEMRPENNPDTLFATACAVNCPTKLVK